MAWTWCIQSAGHVPVSQQAVRLRQLRDGYGCAETDSLLDMMTVRQSQIVEREAANARNSVLHPVRRRHAEEAIVWATNDRDLLRRYRPIFLNELLREARPGPKPTFHLTTPPTRIPTDVAAQ